MLENAFKHGARILVVDDEIANVRLLEMILNDAGYTNVYGIIDPTHVIEFFTNLKPDLILLDLSMPSMDGFEVMLQLQPLLADWPVPILVLTADYLRPTRLRALKEGAQDFVTKPFDDVEVLLRIDNLLRTRFYSANLEATVQQRTQDLVDAHVKALNQLALAGEFRDDDTGLHTRRVGHTSALIAEALGLPTEFVESMRRAAPLHDVGKIGIPDSILLKPGRLSPEEFDEMKWHTIIGAKILSGSSSPLVQLAETIAEHHHERWDGSGYAGIAGADIPLPGRIVSVADVFDALTHDRPYKVAWQLDRAVAEIEAQSGRQFDAEVVSAFMTLPHDDLVEPFPSELPLWPDWMGRKPAKPFFVESPS